jgi:hypothetical protein
VNLALTLSLYILRFNKAVQYGVFPGVFAGCSNI